MELRTSGQINIKIRGTEQGKKRLTGVENGLKEGIWVQRP